MTVKLWPTTLTNKELAQVLTHATGKTVPLPSVRTWITRGILTPALIDGRQYRFVRDDALVGLVILRLQRLVGLQSPLPMRVAREIRPKFHGVLPLEGGRPRSPLEVIVWDEQLPLMVVVPQQELERLADALDELAG